MKIKLKSTFKTYVYIYVTNDFNDFCISAVTLQLNCIKKFIQTGKPKTF